MDNKQGRNTVARGVTIARNILSLMRYLMLGVGLIVLLREPRDWTLWLTEIVGGLYTSKLIYDVDHGFGDWCDIILWRNGHKHNRKRDDE